MFTNATSCFRVKQSRNTYLHSILLFQNFWNINRGCIGKQFGHVELLWQKGELFHSKAIIFPDRCQGYWLKSKLSFYCFRIGLKNTRLWILQRLHLWKRIVLMNCYFANYFNWEGSPSLITFPSKLKTHFVTVREINYYFAYFSWGLGFWKSRWSYFSMLFLQNTFLSWVVIWNIVDRR